MFVETDNRIVSIHSQSVLVKNRNYAFSNPSEEYLQAKYCLKQRQGIS